VNAQPSREVSIQPHIDANGRRVSRPAANRQL
jgi:hypothetical protein